MFKKIEISFINEWKQLFNGYSCYTFTPIKVYFDCDKINKSIEFEFILFGFGFFLSYNGLKPEDISRMFKVIAERELMTKFTTKKKLKAKKTSVKKKKKSK